MINRLVKIAARNQTALIPALSKHFGGGGNGTPSLKPFPRDEASGYYLDPENVAQRLIRIVLQHDKVGNPHDLTLGSSFKKLGIDDLTKVEIFLEIEQEFDLEFADEDVERFKNFGDAVEHVSKSFFAK